MIKFKTTVQFLGRNGKFKASGLDIFFSGTTNDGQTIITIQVLTSRRKHGRCWIQVPAEALPKVIARLKEYEPKNRRLSFREFQEQVIARLKERQREIGKP